LHCHLFVHLQDQYHMTRVAHIQPNATGGRPPEGRTVVPAEAWEAVGWEPSAAGNRQFHSALETPSPVRGGLGRGFSGGNPTQHLQYMPFGETFVEQRFTTSYYTPYTFSAKERDPETGYSYFGARYYSSDISVWLSVDPMAHKYPSMSAYMYCAGNPVMLVDPDGMIIDLSELMKSDFDAFGQLMYDLYLLTGYSLGVDEDGRLVIDYEKGIARNANNSNKKIGSRHARRELRKAIDSQYIYCIKSSKNNDLSPCVDYDDNAICLSLSFVQKMTQNSSNLVPLNIGMGANFFHELSHLRRGTRDPKRNFNRKGSAVRYENKVLRQAGLATRRSYGIKSRDGIFIPYDRKSKMALKNRNSPPADSKFAVFKIQVSGTRDI
jgi:RHS repeat-associated protein